MAEPLDLPPGMVRTPEELLDMANGMSPMEFAGGAMIAASQLGPGAMAGMMQAFQDASTSECDCGPCITLREMMRRFVNG